MSADPTAAEDAAEDAAAAPGPVPSPARRFNGLRWAVMALLGILLVAGVRMHLDARDALARAESAQRAGDREAAIEQYGYAMRAYTPIGGAPTVAADALWDIADDATGRGERALAMMALRRLRAGIFSTRGLFCPFCDLRDPVDQKLAAHIADEQLALGQPTIRGRDRRALVADHLALLRLDPLPDPGWSLLAICGFFAWVGGGFLLVFRGLDVDLRRTPAFTPLAGLVALGLGAWVVGLMLA